MLKLATSNLSEDFLSAHPDFGVRTIGVVPAGTLREVLEAFSHVDAVQNHNFQPHVSVTTDGGRFLVKTSAARLFLYDLDNATGGATELTVDEIVAQLDKSWIYPPTESEELMAARPKTRPRAFQHWTALAMLAVGLLLNGYTLYSAFYIDDVNLAPPLNLITNKAEFNRTRDSLVGTFVTGSYAGDRGIVIQPDGTAQLLLYGEGASIRTRIPCTYIIGRRDNTLYMNLKPRGQIEVSNSDILLLFGDTYHRTH